MKKKMMSAGGSTMKKKMMSAGGNMKKKGYAAGGATMKKKMMSAGGTMKKKMMSAGGMPMAKDPKTGKMMPTFAMDGKGKMMKGGMSMKKGYAAGGAAKKKLFAGSYVFSDTAGTKVKSRFSEDKKKKTKTKDDSASYAKVAAKRKRDAEKKKRQGILNRDTKNRKVATSMQSNLQKSKNKKTDVGTNMFVGAKIELKKNKKDVPTKNKRKLKEQSTVDKLLQFIGGVKTPRRMETDAEMKKRLASEIKKLTRAKKTNTSSQQKNREKVKKLLGISEDKKSFNTLYKPPKKGTDKKKVTKAERDRVNRLFGR